MNLFTRYLAYLRDNPEGYWFKRKLYGWGWTPARWQGWLTMVIFAVLIGASVAGLVAASETRFLSTREIVWELARINGLVILLIIICYKKGERPRWMWGMPKAK